MIEVAAALAAYLALIGWITAGYQWRRAEEYRERYQEERRRRLEQPAAAAFAGAGAAAVDRAIGALTGGGDE